jgi:hypothetical protein
METDYSREIYKKYLNSKDRILVITLRDNTILEGILVSFIHGNPEEGESFIKSWHFIDKNEIEVYRLDISLDSNLDIGRMIEQKNIQQVSFKV